MLIPYLAYADGRLIVRGDEHQLHVASFSNASLVAIVVVVLGLYSP